MPEPIHFRSVRELAEGLEKREFSSLELTELYLARARELDVPPFDLPDEPREDHDGKLATMITIATDHAIESARAADKDLASGDRKSILHGIPYLSLIHI